MDNSQDGKTGVKGSEPALVNFEEIKQDPKAPMLYLNYSEYQWNNLTIDTNSSEIFEGIKSIYIKYEQLGRFGKMGEIIKYEQK